jgi:hypothetical protein
LIAAVGAPAAGEEVQQRQRRATENPPAAAPQGEQARAPERAQERERAVPRTVAPQERRESNASRESNAARESSARRESTARSNASEQARRDSGRYDNRADNRRYDNNNRAYGRNGVTRYAPRVVRPTIIRVAPYRPYVYRPSYRTGVYYGSGGYYPYGATPRGYYDPLPGRYYGGVRITGVPRDAEVFADGYYVGIVNDFDGVFQHVNLEAGRHHIEIDWGGYEPIAFDVYVRPGETTTFRGDGYFNRY